MVQLTSYDNNKLNGITGKQWAYTIGVRDRNLPNSHYVFHGNKIWSALEPEHKTTFMLSLEVEDNALSFAGVDGYPNLTRRTPGRPVVPTPTPWEPTEPPF